MYIYSHNDNKRKIGFKLTLIVMLTVFFTIVVIENVIILVQKETSGYSAQKLSSVNYNSNKNYKNLETASTDIIEDVKKSTVGISLLKPDGKSILDVNVAEKWGMGTGIIVSKKGYILTNQHLAQNVGAKLVISFNDGSSTQGKVIWNEENIDLAIIKVDSKNLRAVNLGDSDYLSTGENVLAIGNPLGIEFQGTVTKGIVSGVNRTFMFSEDGKEFFMEGLIQTDASINPGNSGGPLINENGEVVGINTVKLASAEGIGFAVPINVVKPIIKKLETNGEFEEATLGIYAYDSEIVPYLENNIEFEHGIYVAKVDSYGPSGIAGIKVGDIITKIDGNEIDKMIDLREYIYSKAPGDTIELSVNDGEEKTLQVKLGRK